jgi:hypothetical protein
LTIACPDIIGYELGLKVQEVLLELIGAFGIEIVQQVVQGNPDMIIR